MSEYGDCRRKRMQNQVEAPTPLTDEEDPRWFWAFLKLALGTTAITLGGLYLLDWLEHFFRH